MDKLQGLKLYYFDIPGRAEHLRLLFKIAKIEFEDIRFQGKEWGEKKSLSPWGMAPYVELKDGTMLSDSMSIAMLVAKVANLYPEDVFQQQKGDEIIGVLGDLNTKVNAVGRGMEQEAKNKAREEYIKTGAGRTMVTKIDEFIAKNGSNGHTIGDKLTASDILLFTTLNFMVSGFYDGIPADSLDDLKNIQAVFKSVGALPEVKEFYEAKAEKPFMKPFRKSVDLSAVGK